MKRRSLTAIAAASLVLAGFVGTAEAGGSSLHFGISGGHGLSGHHSIGFGHGRGHRFGLGHGSGRHGFLRGRGHARHGFGFSHGRGHRGSFGFGHHGGSNEAAAALIGVGAGALLYHVIDRSRRQPAHSVRRAHPPVYQPRPVAAPAPRPAPAPAPPQSSRPAPVPSSSTCLQTREYTTTVTIGGQEHDAYGTACLTPDGSWRMGPPQLASTQR